MSHRVRQAAPWSETIGVLITITLIGIGVGLRWASLEGAPDAPALKPYQRSTDDLAPMQRVLMQAALASAPDVLHLRATDGFWPDAERLAASNVPPFDSSFLPRPLRGYRWISYDGGAWVDYLGYDVANTDARTVILRVIDLHAAYHPHPHPGVDYDPDAFFALQLWYFPADQRPYPGERLPEAGWFWLIPPYQRSSYRT